MIDTMKDLPDKKTEYTEKKSLPLAYSLWGLGLVGFSGIHRLYLGQTAHGMALLFTFGGCGIVQLLDVLSIQKLVNISNGIKLEDELQRSSEELEITAHINNKHQHHESSDDELADLLREQEEIDARLKKLD